MYAITSNGILVKKYPTKILMAQIRPKYIIDFPCTKQNGKIIGKYKRKIFGY